MSIVLPDADVATIYVLISKDTNAIFYVGCTSMHVADRVSKHIDASWYHTHNYDIPVNKRIREERGKKGIRYHILLKTSSRYAYLYEYEAISQLSKKYTLTNVQQNYKYYRHDTDMKINYFQVRQQVKTAIDNVITMLS